MTLYAILRRDGWRSAEELEAAAARSSRAADEQMPDDVRWIRSYVLEEGAGSVGTVCIYEATSPEAIRPHAALSRGGREGAAGANQLRPRPAVRTAPVTD